MYPRNTMISLSRSLALLLESSYSYYFLQYMIIRCSLLRKLAKRLSLQTSLNIFLKRTYETSKQMLRIFTVRLRMLIVMLGRFISVGSSSSSSSSDQYTWMKYVMKEGRMNSIVLISYGFIFRQLYTENSLSLEISESIESFLWLLLKLLDVRLPQYYQQKLEHLLYQLSLLHLTILDELLTSCVLDFFEDL